MTNKWRPKNPYTEKVGEAWSDVLEAMRWTVFEEGVNAMMEAIEKIGGKMTNKWRPEGLKNPFPHSPFCGQPGAPCRACGWETGRVSGYQITQATEQKMPLFPSEDDGGQAVRLVEDFLLHVEDKVGRRVCSFPSCLNLAEHHGYCQEHYKRLNRD